VELACSADCSLLRLRWSSGLLHIVAVLCAAFVPTFVPACPPARLPPACSGLSASLPLYVECVHLWGSVAHIAFRGLSTRCLVTVRCHDSGAGRGHQPGSGQWNVGTTSLLAHAVGIAPSKDNYWSVPVQADTHYGPSKRVHAARRACVCTCLYLRTIDSVYACMYAACLSCLHACT